MTALVTTNLADSGAIESALISGDLSRLTPEQRIAYYRAVCDSIGLNPLTKPFDYITLNGKLTLYAKRDAADQLRDKRKVSISRLERERLEDIYAVTAYAQTADGRTDSSIGAVSIAGLKGDALANAMMKAETKAKRRVTLSICGLGWLDETEIETIPSRQPAQVDIATGEIVTTPRIVSVEAVKSNGGDKSAESQGPSWEDLTGGGPAGAKVAQEAEKPKAEPKPRNVKAAIKSQSYGARVMALIEKLNGAGVSHEYSKPDGSLDHNHILYSIGALGFAEITDANLDAVMAALESHVMAKAGATA